MEPGDARAPSHRISVKTFDDRARSFTGSDVDKYYAIRREFGSLVLAPRIQADVIQ